MIKAIFKGLIVATAILGGSAVAAQAAPLQLDSDIFVERQKRSEDGSVSVILAEPKTVVPGDSLVFVVKYKNVGAEAASDFAVTNPMPKAVRYAGSANGLELASVDGGKTYGFLSALKVKNADGTDRAASYADVTHIKWNLKQILAPGQGGKLVFRGVVK